MKKNIISLALLVVFNSFNLFAQTNNLKCYTDEVRAAQLVLNPDYLKIEQQIEERINQYMIQNGKNKFAKTTNTLDTVYHIPVVFHVVHNYGTEYVSDDAIYEALAQINKMYNKQNADTTDVIGTFAGNIPGTLTRYIGKANIKWDLAQIDPNGNPTHGITRVQSYLTNVGGDQSKLNDWPNDKYMNIWLINRMNGDHTGAAAYAYFPGGANPQADGVIALASYLNYDNTISHELGHTLNLQHPWGNTNQPQVSCNGNDQVDDTPPTMGHYNPAGCIPQNLYDIQCAANYSVNYTDSNKSRALYDYDGTTQSPHWYATVNYPDTVNAQNVMDYTYCSKMFTNGQCARMRAALTTSRNSLIAPSNLANSGVLNTWQDLTPIADLSTNLNIVGTGMNIVLTNQSWRDTLSSAEWSLSNGATTPTSNSLTTFNSYFSTPGWVNIKLKVNSNTGTDSIAKNDILFIMDKTPLNALTNTQNFSGDNSKWPIFNFFHTDHRWDILNNLGYDDQACIRYANYDNRNTTIAQRTGTPQGDFADFYTPVYDLSGNYFPNLCTMSFYVSGTYRTNINHNDTLEIAYSNNFYRFIPIRNFTGDELATVGIQNTPFTPSSASDWQLKGFEIPSNVRTSGQTCFRFRFKPGSDGSNKGIGTGNNFYLDKIAFNTEPLGVSVQMLEQKGFVITPNPTNHAAVVSFKENEVGMGKVTVLDLTGKIVYNEIIDFSKNISSITIPAEKLTIKGLYLIQVTTKDKTQTEKLVVY